MLKGPDAKLINNEGKVIGTHFEGPTWRLTDSGEVQGELAASKTASKPGAVAWLLLHAKPGSAQPAGPRCSCCTFVQTPQLRIHSANAVHATVSPSGTLTSCTNISSTLPHAVTGWTRRRVTRS